MTNTKIKVLSAIGFFLIGAFFYTQFQKSQIKQATATVTKLSATRTLINNSGTITKVIANDNQLPDNSQQKATVNALFNAGYVSDKQVLSKVADDKVRKFVKQFLGQLEGDPAQAKKWHVSDNQLQFSQQKDGILFFGALTATNGSRTVNYQLSRQLNVTGNEVTSLTLGNLTRGDQ
ncbi:hypothetical protein [Leuconostoc pseudomesenteroides]|uniref:hypothetical protein n=1 Tax=Leuconostoc pseudomesenteroides TaxID=33968 RepID=UPI001121DCC7|nr:hypothetical protein [Leuconostoc pseudomesenteroides]TOZ01310.1 hypothetical protein DIS14_10855 [Leuconostoc pseudomesenteroides]